MEKNYRQSIYVEWLILFIMVLKSARMILVEEWRRSDFLNVLDLQWIIRGMDWLRETVNFPTPQSQSEVMVVPGRNSPIRYTDADAFRKSVSAGTWEFPELELTHGENRIAITSSGTTTFTYREGRL